MIEAAIWTPINKQSAPFDSPNSLEIPNGRTVCLQTTCTQLKQANLLSDRCERSPMDCPRICIYLSDVLSVRHSRKTCIQFSFANRRRTS